MIDRDCLICDKNFRIKRSQLKVKGGGQYCSKLCFYKRSKVSKTCLVCDSSFIVPPIRKESAKYCSHRCQYYYQKKPIANFATCDNCDIDFQKPPSRVQSSNHDFCSCHCAARYRSSRIDFSGINNPNWKGGVTPIHVLIRTSSKYKQWRVSVFERDDYTCQLCGQRGGKLQADHIKSFSQYPELRLELLNGRTLCISCHVLTDNYGFKSITQESQTS